MCRGRGASRWRPTPVLLPTRVRQLGGAPRIALVDIISYYRRIMLRHTTIEFRKLPAFSTSDAATSKRAELQGGGRRRPSSSMKEHSDPATGRYMQSPSALEHPMQRPAAARLSADSNPARRGRMPGRTMPRRERLFLSGVNGPGPGSTCSDLRCPKCSGKSGRPGFSVHLGQLAASDISGCRH